MYLITVSIYLVQDCNINDVTLPCEGDVQPLVQAACVGWFPAPPVEVLTQGCVFAVPPVAAPMMAASTSVTVDTMLNFLTPEWFTAHRLHLGECKTVTCR